MRGIRVIVSRAERLLEDESRSMEGLRRSGVEGRVVLVLELEDSVLEDNELEDREREFDRVRLEDDRWFEGGVTRLRVEPERDRPLEDGREDDPDRILLRLEVDRLGVRVARCWVRDEVDRDRPDREELEGRERFIDELREFVDL